MSARFLLRSINHLNRKKISSLSFNIHNEKHVQAFSILKKEYLRSFSSLPAHEVVGMPSLSPTMESGSIAKWNKEEGEEFAAGDILCEVETDKATVDFEAQDEGVIAKILREAGPTEIQCGEPILVTVSEVDDVAAFKDFTPGSSAAATPASPEPAALEAPPAPVTPTPSTPTPPPAVAVAPSTDRVVASPKAHKMAKEMGYDVSQISGTGPGGRIIAADVQEFTPSAIVAATTSPAATLTPPLVTPSYTDFPLSGNAQSVASLLYQSKTTVPHYYLTMDISIDALLSMREKINANGTNDLSLNDFLIKASAHAMKSVPSANASWISDEFIRMYHDVHVNISVGSGDQLQMALIRDADKRGIGAISSDISTILESYSTSEEETATPIPVEFQGMGTFTLLNLGMYGVSNGASIIPLPQSCVLTVGSVEESIVPDSSSEAGFKAVKKLGVTLSCDHRVVDGAVGAQWLTAFKTVLETPEMLLL